VVARTTGANRKYFYRRHEYGYWTPWEQIKLDIEDNPVIPHVWKGRLFLFWVKILKQAPLEPDAMDTTSTTSAGLAELSLTTLKTDAGASAKRNAKVTVKAVLCWSEYYDGKWQPARTSDIERPTELGRFETAGANAFDRSITRILTRESSSPEALLVYIQHGFGSSRFMLYNTHSLPVRKEDEHQPPQLARYPGQRLDRVFTITAELLQVTYRMYDSRDIYPRPILNRKDKMPLALVGPTHRLTNPWGGPFFYEDRRHLFYVTTEARRCRCGPATWWHRRPWNA
jgi:hypothetical protein